MQVGVLKEIKRKENRVAMTPAGVEQMIASGHKVSIETTAGEGSGFEDEAYVRAGATIIATPQEIYSACEMIMKVKEPLPVEYGLLREGQMVNDLNVKTSDRISVLMAFLSLLMLPAAWIWPPLLAAGALAMILIVVLNSGLFRFFLRQRGVYFAVGAIPLYWVFLLIGGLGFALGLLSHLHGRTRRGP